MAASSSPSKYSTYWLTRDSDEDGTLSPQVDVWLARPRRTTLSYAQGAFWIGSDDIGLDHRYAVWTIADCIRNAGVYPATDIECIRVGYEVEQQRVT